VVSKLKAYYGDIYALIFEGGDVLALDDPDFSLSDDDTLRTANPARN
jgi:hypothetical protein